MTLSAVALYLLARLRFAPDGTPLRDCVVLGVVMGLGILSKLTALSIVPLGFVAVAQIKAATRQRVKYLLWIGLSCLLVTGGWFARNGLVYGDLLGRYFIIDPATFW